MYQMTCVYNPLTSREKAWSEWKPVAKPKRVVVIGAGPAGMEAALNAAQRGHLVTVLEKSDAIGGQVRVGAGSPSRESWLRIAEFYERQAAKGIFDVRLYAEATPESVLALEPEVVIVATGSRPNRLEIPGGSAALTVHEALAGAADAYRKVVLFDREGFNRPIVAADYLSSRGIELDFVTASLQFSPAVEGMVVDEFYTRFQERGVRLLPGHEVAGWDSAGVLRLRCVQTAQERVLEGVEAVVAAVGSTAVNDLAQLLRGKVAELYVIGDANTPQTVEHATYQGARIGREI
jgi:NADPH-dependent 2,4-dienoyl-CoA reductase/sulfur reductase-like enzyme